MENVHLNGIQQALTKNLSDKLVEVVFTWSAFNLRPGKLGRPESNRSLVLGMDVAVYGGPQRAQTSTAFRKESKKFVDKSR